MSQPPDEQRPPGSAPVFGSSWGLSTDVEPPPPVHEEERYASLGLVGQGGMGTVEAVHDRRLGRDVARKLPSPELPEALALAVLAHEAKVTAALDHPGIVPVHDSGQLPDGRPFFTMRLVKGRTLGAVLDEGHEPADLARLLRLLLEVCGALAHAHEQGVVHADLKPDNVVVGPRNEVQVVDWGLARLVEEGPPVVAGGTPPWSAPEVDRGEPVTPRSDVYALGVVLESTLGRCLGEETTAWPADLAAVVARAGAVDPAQRYATAGALAEDLARWLDGRTVLAHTYTPMELLRRTLRAWRWPLLAAAAILVVGGGAATVSAVRVRAERDRAVAAEDSLRQVASELLDDRAAASLLLDRGPDARAEAERSLELAPSVRAAGVLAALGPPRMSEVGGSAAALDCDKVLALDARGVVCRRGASVVAEDHSGVELWSLPIAATDLIWREDGTMAALHSNRLLAWNGVSHVPALLRPVAGRSGLVAGGPGVYVDTLTLTELHPDLDVAPVVREPCGADRRVGAAAVIDSGAWWVVCSDGALVTGGEGRTPTEVALAQPALQDVVALEASGRDEWLVFGTLRGEVGRVHRQTGEVVSAVSLGLGSIRQLALGPDGVLAAAVDVEGAGAVWRLSEGVSLGRLGEPGVRAVRFTHPDAIEVLSNRRSLWRVSHPSPVRWMESGGVSALAVHPATGAVAVAVGPELVLRDLDTAGVRWRSGLHRRVVKALDFSESGAVLVSGAADQADGLAVAASATGEHRVVADGLAGVRTLDLSAEGRLAAAPYAPRVAVWDDISGEPRSLALPRTPVAVRWSEDALWVLDEAGTVWRGDDPLTEVLEVPDAVGLEVSGTVVVVLGASLWVIEDGVSRELDVSGDWTALGLSLDGTRAMLGALDGSVQQVRLSDGVVELEARGHTERVSAVVPLPDGWLTAGWDGQVRRWHSLSD